MDYTAYAAIYDAEYSDYAPEVNFYMKWAKRLPPPALELGCGTGRVMMALARAGVPVWGLESCDAMLHQAQTKVDALPADLKPKVQLRRGDMRDFDLGQEFGLIYLPFREFMHLGKEEEQLDCLDAIHRHLSPQGRLILNLYHLDLTVLSHMHGGDVAVARQRGGDYQDPGTGQQVVCSSASWFDANSQTLHEERFYDRYDARGVVQERRVVPLSQRWFTRWEMHHLLHRAQFRVEVLLGGPSGQPFTGAGSEMIWVARPATAAELDSELEWLHNKRARLG